MRLSDFFEIKGINLIINRKFQEAVHANWTIEFTFTGFYIDKGLYFSIK